MAHAVWCECPDCEEVRDEGGPDEDLAREIAYDLEMDRRIHERIEEGRRLPMEDDHE